MPSSTDQLRSLIEGLYSATLRGSIKWLEVQNSQSFVSLLKHGRAEIVEDENDRGEPLYIINIYNKDGGLVDKFNDEIFKGSRPQNFQERNYFDLMGNLFGAARRNATGADQIVAGMIEEIGAPQIDSDDVPF